MDTTPQNRTDDEPAITLRSDRKRAVFLVVASAVRAPILLHLGFVHVLTTFE